MDWQPSSQAPIPVIRRNPKESKVLECQEKSQEHRNIEEGSFDTVMCSVKCGPIPMLLPADGVKSTPSKMLNLLMPSTDFVAPRVLPVLKVDFTQSLSSTFPLL